MLETEVIADIELNRLADELSAIFYVPSRKTDVQPAATVAKTKLIQIRILLPRLFDATSPFHRAAIRLLRCPIRLPK